jgi:hypothetical protein
MEQKGKEEGKNRGTTNRKSRTTISNSQFCLLLRVSQIIYLLWRDSRHESSIYIRTSKTSQSPFNSITGKIQGLHQMKQKDKELWASVVACVCQQDKPIHAHTEFQLSRKQRQFSNFVRSESESWVDYHLMKQKWQVNVVVSKWSYIPPTTETNQSTYLTQRYSTAQPSVTRMTSQQGKPSFTRQT